MKVQPRIIRNPFPLRKLPQELQDRIFEFAYEGPDDTVPKRLKWSWASGSGQLPSPRKYTVNAFLVDKAWFVAAAKVYIGNRHWDAAGFQPEGIELPSNLDVEGSWECEKPSQYLFRQFATGVTIDRDTSYKWLSLCIALRDLTLTLRRREHLKGPEQKDPCYSREALSEQFAGICGLRNAIVIFSPVEPQRRTQAERWAANWTTESEHEYLQRRTDEIRSIVTRPRDSPQPRLRTRVLGYTPLYFGSRVCFDTHRLLPPGYARSISPWVKEGEDEEDLIAQAPRTAEELFKWTGMNLVDFWRFVLEHADSPPKWPQWR